MTFPTLRYLPLHEWKVLELEETKHPSALPLHFIAEETDAS